MIPDALKIRSPRDAPVSWELHGPGAKAWKSVVLVSRLTERPRAGDNKRDTPKSIRLSAVLDGVTLVLDLSTLGNEALTTLLTTALDDVTTGFGGHAGTEAVLILARTF